MRQILCGIAEALTDLHDRRIVHADLKPSNVVVKRVRIPGKQRDRWAVCVVDFGLSVKFDEHSIGGTGVYMSSEQLLNIMPLSGFSDMHRCGSLMLSSQLLLLAMLSPVVSTVTVTITAAVVLPSTQ